MKLPLVVVAAAVMPIGAIAPQAQIADKVVVIRSDFGQNRAGVGTGFFISGEGRILTAYHVIQNARHLTVTYHGTAYKDVVIERISPDRDLATLVVGPLSRPTPFLRLATELYPGVENETLRIVGHPDGNLYRSVDVRMTTPLFVKSGTIRVAGQAPVFRLTDVDLIHIAAIVNSGMSGAPLVSSRGVIGVLSGSRDEGGSLGWAIPAKYVTDPTMRRVNKRAEDMRGWDELRLMLDRWKNLRHAIRIDDRVLSELDKLFNAVEAMRLGYEQFAERAEASVSTVRMARIMADQRVREGRDLLPQDSVVLDLLQERFTAVVEAGNAWMEARGRAMSNVVELELLIEAEQGSLPRTQRNDSIIDGFKSERGRLEQRLAKGDSALAATRQRMMQGILTLVATGTSADVESPAGLARVTSALEPVLIGLADEEARRATAAESHLLGETAAFLERMLTADYDDANTSARWNSGLGYELTVPAGWEQGGAEEPGFADLARQLGAQGITLDAIFGRALGPSSDTLSGVSMIVVGRSLGAMSRSTFDSLARAAELDARTSGAEVERVDGPRLNAYLVRDVSVTGPRRVLRCIAVMYGPVRPVVVILTAPPDRHDLLLHCKAIVESATLD